MKKFNIFSLILTLIFIVVNLLVGGLSVDYILSWFSLDIPLIGDVLIGFFVAKASIPIAICGFILKLFGIF